MPEHAKRASESYTECIHIVFPEHLNGGKRVFGGTMASWIDEAAAITARRHTRRNVFTVRISELEFLAPAYADDVLIRAGHVIYTGRTSLEVCVETFIERLNGTREEIGKAYLTFVATDENGRPVQVPPLLVESDEEKRQWSEEEARRAARTR